MRLTRAWWLVLWIAACPVCALAVASCSASAPARAPRSADAPWPGVAELDARWHGEGAARRLPAGVYATTFDGLVDPPPGASWQERVEFSGRYALDVDEDGAARLLIDYLYDSALSGPGFAQPALATGEHLYLWTGRVELASSETATLHLEPARHDDCQQLGRPQFAQVAFDPGLCSRALEPLVLTCQWQADHLPEGDAGTLRDIDLLWCHIEGGHMALDSWITLSGRVPLSRRPGVHFHHQPEQGHQEVRFEL